MILSNTLWIANYKGNALWCKWSIYLWIIEGVQMIRAELTVELANTTFIEEMGNVTTSWKTIPRISFILASVENHFTSYRLQLCYFPSFHPSLIFLPFIPYPPSVTLWVTYYLNTPFPFPTELLGSERFLLCNSSRFHRAFLMSFCFELISVWMVLRATESSSVIPSESGDPSDICTNIIS